ncbi:unnamed protein product [Brassicogethes aeneus]|uniref:acid phosphatase n=1 Tax=Brassicogethes aeneus TaxID=1431903 RepID=A0A9P0AY71_BRAAE|nr:unnamed protein product [Brassicogethes aeneus]
MLTNYLYFISALMIVCGHLIQKDEGELVQLSIIFRHGARTTDNFYPNDPHKNLTFYPIGLGGLTPEGKYGEYALGKYFRKYYGQFLGETYSEKDIFVRSTDYIRTRMSAQLVMTGLFPPKYKQTWHPEINWQPIPIDYKLRTADDFLHRRHNCPFFETATEAMDNIIEIKKKYIEPHSELFEFLRKESGLSIKNPYALLQFYFILNTESEMNLTLPKWTNSIFPDKIYKLSVAAYEYQNFIPEVRKINSGYLFKKILQDAETKMTDTENKKSYKALFYSGHEITIGFMLNALGVDQNSIPKYSSALIFELRKKNNSYFIKLRYRKNINDNEPMNLKVPGCDTLCPIEQFKKLYEELLPIISMEDACRQDYTSNHLK